MAVIEEKICKWCSKSFTPEHWSSVYCSEECHTAARQKQIKENNKRAYEKNKIKAVTKRCLVCHHRFSTNRSDIVTCSPYCQEIRRKEQQKAYRQNKRVEAKKKKPVSIAEFNRRAREMGMTYGEYELHLRLHGKEQKNVI